MFKVLIVDDEPLVREGLKTIIEWEQYGYYVCGEGVDGRDGASKIHELKPDLVLVDIKMPGLNGIELLEKARENGFDGKAIILTGYSEFEYAHKAIRLGVKSYLLKPIMESELIEAITKIYEEIKAEKNTQRHLVQSRKYLKEQALRNIITGSASEGRLQEDVNLWDLNFDFSHYWVAIIDVSSSREPENKNKEIAEYMHHLAEASGDLEICVIEDRVAAVFKEQNADKKERQLKHIHGEMAGIHGANVFIAVGRTVDNIVDVQTSYKDAKALADRRFLYEDLQVVVFEDISNKDYAQIDKDIAYVESIYTSMEIGDTERLNSLFTNMENYFKYSDLSVEKIKGICVNYFIELKEKLTANYSEHKDNFPSNEVIVQNIYDKRNLRSLLDYLKEEFIMISNLIYNESSENTMKRIINYIQKNYNKDLKLELLADLFAYNSSYLGKIFRNYTGESFNTYLDKVRIENAKTLLEDNLKVYQVSEKVGYKNINYFYSKFKKHVGVSPQEYKKQ